MHTHLVIIAWLAPVINALQTPPRKKVVVVGAGWAGLSTAWTLSKNNVDVTLVDAAARPGGVVRDGFTTRGGRPAEAGQHGFWEEYFNIYKLLYDELKLQEDPLTGYAEQGEYLCGNQISGPPRHRRDIVPVTTSARWRGGSTSSHP